VPLELLALVLPAGLDAFAVSASLAMGGLETRERQRVAIVFPLFESGMPVLGFVAGASFAAPLGDLADILAAAVLAAIGFWLAFESRDEIDQARRLARARGPALLVLGAAIGLDELGIGAGAGLLDQSPFLVLGLIALEAVIATPLGLAVGSRLRRLNPVLFERLAGTVLVALASTITIGALRSGHF